MPQRVLADHDGEPVPPPARDSVAALDSESRPAVVSISDIHGHLGDARSALLTLADHPEYDAVVETDAARRLQWAGGEAYVLVFNGDLIDRGPNSEKVIAMVERLIDQAPPGHVRYTVGNHELGVLVPDRYGWGNWYSGQQSDEQRLAFIEQIFDGNVIAAYEGYDVTFSHAGRPGQFSAEELNDSLSDAADDLEAAIGTDRDTEVQNELGPAYPDVFGVDGRTGRGPDAGVAWLDFEYMPEDAPPQVIGHTRHEEPTQKGQVVCGNVIRNNRRTGGGEGIVVETPNRLFALCRGEDETLTEYEFSLPAKAGQEM